ncbi:MAG: hypothetical protein K6F07_00685 [Bacilli bacterium]|nr:hypothetical protein [Bacilli bacterium]
MSKIKDPSKKTSGKKLPLHPAELVWYIICGLVGLWGLVYIVLGLIAQNLPITAEDNKFVAANNAFAKTFGLDWLGWGLIILAIAAVAAVIVLLSLAGKSDREYEKKTRRAARLAQLELEEEKEEQQGEVVDAEVKDVEEKPAEEPAEEKPQE